MATPHVEHPRVGREIETLQQHVARAQLAHATAEPHQAGGQQIRDPDGDRRRGESTRDRNTSLRVAAEIEPEHHERDATEEHVADDRRRVEAVVGAPPAQLCRSTVRLTHGSHSARASDGTTGGSDEQDAVAWNWRPHRRGSLQPALATSCATELRPSPTHVTRSPCTRHEAIVRSNQHSRSQP